MTDCTGALSEADQADAERMIAYYLAQLTTTDEALAALRKEPGRT